jgi:MATE family multidrug resistance protein
MGTTGIVAQIHGSGDTDEIRPAVARAALVGLSIAIIILLFRNQLASIGINLVGGTEEVKFYALVYFNIAIWGAPAVLLSYTLLGVLLGMQNARATLYVSLVVNVINILLDLIFVFGLDMGVSGVALASVIAQYTGVSVAIYLCHTMLKDYPGRWHVSSILNARQLGGYLKVNQDIFIRTLCLIFTFAFFTRQGAKQGDMILAANAVLLNFQTLLALGLDGFANAAEALIGKAIGAKNRDHFWGTVKDTSFWAVIIAISFVLLFAIFGNVLVSIMTDIEEVKVTARVYLPWIIISPLISVWCFQLDGIFIGATKGKEMRDMMLVSTFLFFLPAWYLLQGYGNHGLWLALMIFFLARGLTLAFAWSRLYKRTGFI